ncbi:MAG: hypothetical protein VX438_10470 [Planctomycetota bacterium]|nr:hypothetical protein [Planctomycetota bacterium]
MIFSNPKELPWTVVCGGVICLLAVLLVLGSSPAPRVGDGGEYLMMTIALAEEMQPFSDFRVERIYGQYIQTRDGSFPSAHKLQETANGLTLGDQMDFPHFWFFSLLAVPFYHFLNAIGGDIGHCFTLLNLSLMGLLLWVADRSLGRRGITIALVICLLSPVLWFIDKGHTEFFTVSLATIGVIRFLKNDFTSSIAAFCLVSTQNPPFIGVAGLVGLFGLSRDWKNLRVRWPILVLGLGIGLLHPVYYLVRHGNITPQMITGAASHSAKGLRELTCFFVDPDVGLLSNWPWLLVPLLFVLGYVVFRYNRVNGFTVGFCAVSLLVLCWAQTKTNNFNHGGTVKISRYAVWYIPFAFPLLFQFATNYRLAPTWQRWSLFGFLAAAVYVNTTKFHPDRGESFLYQTTIAENFYENFPGWYDPIPEIFIERCVRAELPTQAWAVSNRAGTKLIVHSGRLIKQRNWLHWGRKLDDVIGSEKPIDPAKLVQYINRESSVPTAIEWFYVNDPGDVFRNPAAQSQRVSQRFAPSQPIR